MKINTPGSGSENIDALTGRQSQAKELRESKKTVMVEQDSVRKAVAPELSSIQDAEMLGKNLAGRLNLNQRGALDAVGQLDEARIESLLSDED